MSNAGGASRSNAVLKHRTINRDVSSIKASFNRAVDWGILPSNPLAKVKKARVDDCLKVRYLSEAEETRLRAAIEAREERRRAERDSANGWRAERGYAAAVFAQSGFYRSCEATHPALAQHRMQARRAV
ncbi:MAG: hypothetical protein IPP23_03210 [Sphingomonadales bacterium]|nr:hypothetical protein [Sphingomonadales bacterium]